MDPSIFAATFAVFFVAHGIADYWVQTDWQAQNKGKNGVALGRHVTTYTLTFIPALLAVNTFRSLALWEVAVAVLAIGLPHAALDTRKLITWFCATTKGWRPDNMVPWPVTPERLMEDFRGNGAEEAFVVATRADLDAIAPTAEADRLKPWHFTGNQFAWIEDERKVASRYQRTMPTEAHPNQLRWGVGGWDADFADLRPLNPWEIAVRFHVTIALDQQAHFLCLALVAAWLAAK